MDFGAITAAVSSLKTALDIANTAIDVRDSLAVDAKVREILTALSDAHIATLSAHTEQLALINRVRELEEAVASFEQWETESKRYELHEVASGRFTYRPKRIGEGGEPEHQLCASCYNDKRKSILQTEIRTPGRAMVLVCPQCKLAIYLSGFRRPEH